LPLEAAPPGTGWDDARIHECPRCGGLFVPRDALAELLCRSEATGPFPEPIRAPVVVLDEVRYVPCPQCHTKMNRVNFGRLSGVIVDVCRTHGTWFDAGELTRVVAFAARGGLDRTSQREAQDRKDAAADLRQSRLREHDIVPSHYEAGERLDDWRALLKYLFSW
jgi:Zn-finger nucleic acid-binding protein